jgi:PAS domain S-box-containing protein
LHPCPLKTVFETGKPFAIEHIHHDGEGNELVVALHALPLFDDAGKVIRVAEFSQNITERRKEEEKLKQSELELTAIFDNSPLLMILLDEETKILKVNKATETATGMTSEEIIGMRGGEATRCIHHLDVPEGCGFGPFCQDCAIRNTVLDTLQTGNSYNQVEADLSVANGEEEVKLNFLVSSTILTINNKRTVLVTLQDITKRRQVAEEARKLSRVVKSSPSAVAITDTEGRLEYVNPRFTEMTGYSVDEVIGKNPRVLNAGIQPKEFYQKLWSTIKAGKEWHGVFANKRKNGEVYWENARIAVITDENGEITNFVKLAEDITKRRQTEKALREEKLLAQQYLDVAGVMIVALDSEQKVTQINQMGCRILGYQPEEIVGKNWFTNFLPETDLEAVGQVYSQLMAGELEPVEYFENKVLTSSGEERIISWHNALLKEDNGRIIGILSSGRDITEQKLAEKAREQMYQLVLEGRNMFLAGSVVIFKWRNEEGWPVEYVSENVEGIFGYLASDWTSGKISYADILHKDDVERIGSEVRHFSESGASKFEHEPYRVIREDGEIVWLIDHTTILRNEAGDITHYLGYVVDITRRKQVEEELRKSEERYRSIWKNSPVGIALTNRKARFTMANPAFCKILGYQKNELNDRPLFELLAEEDNRLFDGILNTDVHKKLSSLYGSHPTELTLLKKNGNPIIVDLSIDFITAENNSVDYMIVQMTDITERRRIQQAIEQAKQQWENTFYTVPDQIMIIDTKSVIKRVNKSCAAYLNVKPAEMVGTQCDKWYRSRLETLSNTCPRKTAHRTRQVQHVEYHNPDDDTFFHTSVTPLVNKDNKTIGVVHVTRDITQMKIAEKALRETREVQQRQAMFRQIEDIFSSIRHEIGNALNTLKTTLNVLYTNIDRFPVEKRDIYFRRALDTFGSAERMLRVLKEYQRFDELHPEELHLDRFITEKIGILIDNAKSAGVKLHYQPGLRGKIVKADRDALMRIILNLVDNAIHATRDLVNPTITISTYGDRDWLYLCVRDNGVGIAEDEGFKVFTPLYTTRPDGSGLGLAIVQKLMQQMGGSVRLDSTPGKGAKFELRLHPA